MPILPIGHSHSKHQGFTLHELLVTMVIMVIMCAVIAGEIGPAVTEARLRAVTSMAVSQLQFARSYAITNRTTTAVFFDSATPAIAVLSVAPDSNATTMGTNVSSTTNWLPVTTQAGFYQPLPHGITITDVSLNNNTGVTAWSTTPTYTPVETTSAAPAPNRNADEGQLITFSPAGVGEDVSITLRDARGDTRTILVDAITGRCDLANTNNDQTTSTTTP